MVSTVSPQSVVFRPILAANTCDSSSLELSLGAFLKFLVILLVSAVVSASAHDINFMMAFGILAGVTIMEATAQGLAARAARRGMPVRSE
jgi:hypothetical protein